jgi:outer membrane receptor for ferrienterochelin and colicins
LYCNEVGVTVSGVEFNGKIRTQLGLSAAVSYNYLYASGNSMQSQFSQPRRHSMTCHIDYDKQIFKNYSISASVSCRYMSKSRDAAAPDKAYSIWKATLNQRLVKAYSLTFVIDNLFNYKPKVFYLNTPTTIGTNFSVGLSVDIDSLSF